MAKKIQITDPKKENPALMCRALEDGNILFFPKIPFKFAKKDIDFLLTQKQSGSKSRKNIAYKPQKDCITNCEGKDKEKLYKALKSYSYNVQKFLGEFLKPYEDQWHVDYASFRPFQEKGRDLRIRARNDLLHLDAFPTRPMHGKRILRFFTNINQNEPRNWVTGDSFSTLLEKFGKEVGLPKKIERSLLMLLLKKAKGGAKKLGFPVNMRSPYDEFMLKFHHFLKENENVQKIGKKDHWSFPPLSCWMVFTDQVTHAALSGQYALEQTFLVPKFAMLQPEKAPVSVLERLTGYTTVTPEFS